MGTMPKTAIVVPCYNEENRLNQEHFLEYAESNPDVHFLFINDGSTDGTEKILDALCTRRPQQLQYLNLERNSGKAEAVRRGMLIVVDEKYDQAGYWDADLATPLCAIDSFKELLGNNPTKAVLGSRVRLLGREIDRKPLRHYLGRVFATAASLFLGLTIYDTQCGSKLFSVNKELREVFGKPFLTSWIFDVEILARLIVLNGEDGANVVAESIIEYPLEKWMDIPGSKLKIYDFFKAGYELMIIFSIVRIPFIRNKHFRSLTGS